MLRINKTYLSISVILFFTEAMIALFVHDNFVRPYLGDFLVVLLLYAFVKAFIQTSVLKASIAVLLFAYLLETLQYLNILTYLGLAESRVANVVLGNYFTWIDMLAYTLGFAAILLIENYRLR